MKSLLSRMAILAIIASTLVSPQAVLANNAGENAAWQFETTQDKVNRAAIEDLRLKKASGYYAAPVYNTYIAKQFNCSVSSQALGNQGTTTAVGNSPTSSGNSASSTGNSSSSSLGLSGAAGSSSITNGQQNPGEVGSSASGEVSTSVNGNSYQTLNNTQTNSGAQSSSVSASNACAFGVLN